MMKREIRTIIDRIKSGVVKPEDKNFIQDLFEYNKGKHAWLGICVLPLGLGLTFITFSTIGIVNSFWSSVFVLSAAITTTIGIASVVPALQARSLYNKKKKAYGISSKEYKELKKSGELDRLMEAFNQYELSHQYKVDAIDYQDEQLRIEQENLLERLTEIMAKRKALRGRKEIVVNYAGLESLIDRIIEERKENRVENTSSEDVLIAPTSNSEEINI